MNNKISRSNEIGDKDAAEIGEVIFKLINLSNLNLDFW